MTEIYGSPASNHNAQIIGHIADDGNIYNTSGSEFNGESNYSCVGHIAADGNVYNTSSREFNSESSHSCVGHIASNGNIYNTSSFELNGESGYSCVGHVQYDGKVYNVPKTSNPGYNYCVGHVTGSNYYWGAAALLLLLKPQSGASASSTYGSSYSAGSGSCGGGGAAAGPSYQSDGRRATPVTTFKTEDEFARSFIFRIFGWSFLGSLLGILLADANVPLGVAFGFMVGTAVTLYSTIFPHFYIYFAFDTRNCRRGWLNTLFRRVNFYGWTLPLLLVASAVLMLLAVFQRGAFTGFAVMAAAIIAGLLIIRAIKSKTGR